MVHFKMTLLFALSINLFTPNFAEAVEPDSLATVQPVRLDSLVTDLSGRNHWINDSNTRSWLALGAVAVTGATTILLKEEANSSYNDYSKSLNSSQLNRSNQYDVYSGIALIAMQLSLGWLLYELNNRQDR